MSRHASDELDLEDLQETVTQLMTDLPAPERLVLSLYYCEELTWQEIGQVLQLPARPCRVSATGYTARRLAHVPDDRDRAP
jgi:DNA-directed RNA polymerase specialized sigma subunit